MRTVLTVVEWVEQVVPQPTADAPANVRTLVNRVLGLVFYASIVAATGIFLAMGVLAWSGDRGMSGGISPEMKSKGIAAVIGLVLAGSASGLVTFLT